MLLRDPRTRATVTALDVDPDMVRAARRDAARLGTVPLFRAPCPGRAPDPRPRPVLARETVGTTGEPPDPETSSRPCPGIRRTRAVANPPYRPVGSGRSCPGRPQPGQVRFARDARGFLDAAAFFLTNKGTAWFVHLASCAGRAARRTGGSGLEPRAPARVLAPRRPGRLILVEAIKNSGPGLVLEPTASPYREETDQGSRRPRLTDQALALCLPAANA
jgi:hypothetical protein